MHISVAVCCSVLQSGLPKSRRHFVCLYSGPKFETKFTFLSRASRSLQFTTQRMTRALHPLQHCNTLQHLATSCNTLQNTATNCQTLQHAATRCNTYTHLQYTLQDTYTHLHTHTYTHVLDINICIYTLYIYAATRCNTLQHTYTLAIHTATHIYTHTLTHMY